MWQANTRSEALYRMRWELFLNSSRDWRPLLDAALFQPGKVQRSETEVRTVVHRRLLSQRQAEAGRMQSLLLNLCGAMRRHGHRARPHPASASGIQTPPAHAGTSRKHTSKGNAQALLSRRLKLVDRVSAACESAKKLHAPRGLNCALAAPLNALGISRLPDATFRPARRAIAPRRTPVDGTQYSGIPTAPGAYARGIVLGMTHKF